MVGSFKMVGSKVPLKVNSDAEKPELQELHKWIEFNNFLKSESEAKNFADAIAKPRSFKCFLVPFNKNL